MEKVVLIKNNKKQEFTPLAAKIAVEHLGWAEFHPMKPPDEIFTKTRPPEIIRPVKLIDPEVKPNVEPKAEVKPEPVKEVKPEVKVLPEKKTRKPRTKSKSK